MYMPQTVASSGKRQIAAIFFIMTSETTGQTFMVKTEESAAPATDPAAVRGDRMFPMGHHHIHREDVRKIWKECQEESFWYRALPLSLGSMAVTGGLIYNGVWKSSKRFGPFPKLAVAGILGFAVGKASYVGTCRSKFQEFGLGGKPGSGPWSEGPGFGPFKNRDHGHRYHHAYEECRKKAQAAPAEEVKS